MIIFVFFYFDVYVTSLDLASIGINRLNNPAKTDYLSNRLISNAITTLLTYGLFWLSER